MAVKIPIVTVFDSKGLRQAQFQLNKVSGNIANLNRNFAIAGGIFAGIAVGLGKATTAASNFEAEFEGVNQVFGSAAKSVQDFGRQAAKSAGLSNTAALQGAKTLGLFATGAGLSEQEAANFATTLVQLAGDLGSFNDVPTPEALAAIQSGLMGQAEPLRKFGVFLTDARLRAKALQMGIYDGTGALTDQQKMLASYNSILEQTTIQQGDFVKYQETFGNQTKSLTAEIANLQIEIGNELLPIMADILPIIRELVSEFGSKLTTAVKSVDWASFITSIVNVLTFFVEHIETITKVVAAIYLLNTAYNVTKIAVALFNAGAVILNATFVRTAAGIQLATGALKLFRTALVTTGVGALVVGLGFIIEAIINTNEAASDGTPVMNDYGTAIRNSGTEAEQAANKYRIARTEAGSYIKVLKEVYKLNPRQADRAAGITDVGSPPPGLIPDPIFEFKLPDGKLPDLGGAAAKTVSGMKALRQELAKEVKKQSAFVRLTEKKGLSEGLASQILGGKQPLKTAAKIVQGTQKAAKKLQNIFNKTSAGRAEAAQASAAAEAASAAAAQAASQAAAEFARQQAEEQAELARAQEEQARKEQAALDERERIYKAFADSVSGTFSRIKDQILGAFTLPELGGSTNAIIRNMDKLLTRVKAFSQNITKLSSMGLDPKLLQQVINAGPIAGAKLAANLVAGGVGGLAAINAGYSELGNVAGEIGMTGTQAMFGTQAQQTIYNLTVNGGLDSGASIGKAVVDAIKAYERTSGVVFQGA